MLITRRLMVWFLETSVEALTLGSFLAVLLGHDAGALLKDILIYSTWVAVMFVTTGYVLTTILARTLWKGKGLIIYPAIATGLFIVHFAIMSIGVGGAFSPRDRLAIMGSGVFIVFACTLAGTFALKKWIPTSRHLADALPGG